MFEGIFCNYYLEGRSLSTTELTTPSNSMVLETE